MALVPSSSTDSPKASSGLAQGSTNLLFIDRLWDKNLQEIMNLYVLLNPNSLGVAQTKKKKKMELTRTFPNLEWVEYQKLELKFWAAQMLLLSYSHRLRWHGFSLPDFLSDVSETWHFALACFLSCDDYSQLPLLSLPVIFFNLSLACFIYFKSLYRKN